MLSFKIIVCFALVEIARSKSKIEPYDKFPDDFKFGAATAGYQVEGGWNANGKGESIWDVFTHEHPDRILDGSNGDVAMDSYHLYEKDAAALNYLGADVYRFSLSWTRLLPTGFVNQSNPDGIRYYNALIDKLLAYGIEPVVTIYHWDTPEPLQRLGGFLSRDIIPYYLDYCQFAWEQFGDRVKTWITFNEINIISVAGYARTTFAPGTGLAGHGEYLAAHHMLLSNAFAYRLYKKLPCTIGGGKIGIAHQALGYSLRSNSARDIQANNLAQIFSTGWILHPIFTPAGDYPEEMKAIIGRNSLAQNYPRSRLPQFTPEEVELVKGSADFLGINHYTSFVFTLPDDPITNASYATQLDLSLFTCEDFPVLAYRKTEWFYLDYELNSVAPDGFRDILTYISRNFGEPPIIITEFGFPYLSDGPNLNDLFRVDYYRQYLNAILQARRCGANVWGAICWSLIDTFEWYSGYTIQFGLYQVNQTSVDKLRTCRLSCEVIKEVIATKRIDFNSLPDYSNPVVF